MASFTPSFQAFQFFAEGSESGAESLASAGQNISLGVLADTPIQLRTRIQETAGKAGGSSDSYRLQYSKNGGTWTDVTTISSNVKGFDSTYLTDGGATTKRISGGSGSFIAGKISETGIVSNFQLTANNHTEFLYSLSLISSDLSTDDYLEFRVLLNGSTMSTLVTPRVTKVNLRPSVTLETLNEETFASGQPTLEFIGVDPEGDNIEYEVAISDGTRLGTFVNYEEWDDGAISAVAVNSANGDVWICTSGTGSGKVLKQSGGQGSFVDMEALAKNWTDIDVDAETGDVWVCETRGVAETPGRVYRLPEGSGTWEMASDSFPDIGITICAFTGICVNPTNGDVWVTHRSVADAGSGAILQLQGGTGTWVDRTYSSSHFYNCITVDSANGDVYIGIGAFNLNNNGVVLRRTSGGSWYTVTSFGDRCAQGIAIDPDTKDIWISESGSTSAAAHKLSKRDGTTTTVTEIASDSPATYPKWRKMKIDRGTGAVFVVENAVGVYKADESSGPFDYQLVRNSNNHAGFENLDSPENGSPFNSGDKIAFTVQEGDALADGTYHWRVRGKDVF